MQSQALKYVPANVMAVIVSFGTIVLLTRLLSAEEFGRYALIITTMNFTAMGLFTWLEASAARFRARADRNDVLEEHSATLLKGAILALIGLLPVFVFIVVFGPFSERLKTLLSFALATLTMQLLAGIIEEDHKAGHHIWRYSLLVSSQKLAGLMIGVALIILTPLREAGPLIGLCFGAVIVLALESPQLLRTLKNGRLSSARLRRYFQYGAPIGLTLVLAYFLEVGDLYLIAFFLGEEFVGTYNAGYGLANNLIDYLFVWLAMGAMPVAIYVLENTSLDESRSVIASYGETLIFIVFPAAAGLGVVATEIGFLLGEPVRVGAVQIMPWVAGAAVINGFVNIYVHQAFVLSEKLKVMSLLMVIPVLINIGLNVVLIPQFALFGAIAATLIAYGVAFVLTASFARRYYPLPLLGGTVVRSGLATILMVLTITMVPFDAVQTDLLRLALKILTGVIAYGLFTFMLDAASIRSKGARFWKSATSRPNSQ